MGIDEAGRGAWAGPLVVVGCCLSDSADYISELGDSKVLSKRVREKLYDQIYEDSETQIHVAVIEPRIIDDLGLSASLCLASAEIAEHLPRDIDIVIDGPHNFLKNTVHGQRVHAIIKADASVPAVMAASIVAKVTRDRIMHSLATAFPGYGFERHVGYGTATHRTALEKHGVTLVHRRSYKPIALLLSAQK